MIKLYQVGVNLTEVLKRVREEHPVRGHFEVDLSKSVLEEVRESLASCSLNEIPRLAHGFDLKRILACLEILVNDRQDEIAEKAAKVLRVRPRDQVIYRGWFKLINSYRHELLEQTLRDLISHKGFSVLEASDKVSERAPFWFVSTLLVQGIVRDYERTEKKSNLDNYLQSNLLEPEQGVFREAWRQLLKKGSPKSLLKEDPQRILVEYRKVDNAPLISEFCQHYLMALKSRESWDDHILEFIRKKFSEPLLEGPKDGLETPFWKKISEPVKQEYRTWLMLQQVEEFFEGERAAFWKGFVELGRIRRVREILGGDGFMLDFFRFGIIEFKHVGNAAYVYPREIFDFYWNQARYKGHPSLFKDKERTLRHQAYRTWDGRIIHRENWKYETRKMINRLLGQRDGAR